MHVSEKIRRAAERQNCTIRIPGICNNDRSTVVFCHGPDKHRGKQMKAPDHWGAFGCKNCHDAMDLREVDNLSDLWLPAILETQNLLVSEGIISYPIKTKRPPKTTKIMNGPTRLQRSFGQP